MATGVYQIRNLVNGKRYIGSAANKRGFDQRWSIHRTLLLQGKHHSSKLQNAWNKYGVASFAFEILEECQISKCIEREQHYLDMLLFASNKDGRFDELGYNINRKADSRFGAVLSDETKAKISRAHLGKKCSEITLQRLRTARYGKRNTEKQKFVASISNRGENAPLAKLTAENVTEIRRLFGTVSQRAIAKRFGVSEATVSMIKTGKNWRYV
jgi:group I intron endonuclease